MRNMTNEEMKKLYESLKEEIEKASKDGAFSVGNWNTSAQPMTTKYTMPPHPNILGFGYGVSPTDVDGHSQYEYQEPEVDEQGTYYGYKILIRWEVRGCGCPECFTLKSPRCPVLWKNGELEADREPSEKSMFGIHFAKRPNHPALREYTFSSRGNPYYGYYAGGDDPREKTTPFLVKCALSGNTIIETEQGFRAQHATIVAVMELGENYHGNWESYSDYQERSTTHPRRNTDEEKRVDEYTYRPSTRYTWDFTADWDSNP